MSIKVKIHNGDGNPMDDTYLEIYDDTEEVIDVDYPKLEEGNKYEYKFSSDNMHFQTITVKGGEKSEQIVAPSKRTKGSTGELNLVNFVGHLELAVFELENEIGTISFYVEDHKLKEDKHNQLLKDIARINAELLMFQGAPVSRQFKVNSGENRYSIYQKFAYIKSLLKNDRLGNALRQVFANPVKKWSLGDCEIPITKIKRLSNKELRQVASSSNRVAIRESISGLSSSLQSLPNRIIVKGKDETTDTPENRFVKYVIEDLYRICVSITECKNASPFVKYEAKKMGAYIIHYAQHTFFKGIGKLNQLNINNTVLQRKEGYRQILKIWLETGYTSTLTDTTAEVYGAKIRKVSQLYENWCAIRLFKIVCDALDISVLEPRVKIISLNLALSEDCWLDNQEFNIDRNKTGKISYYYNKSFKGNKKSEDWSVDLRPDYTIKITIGKIPHYLHFDGKYKYIETGSDVLISKPDDIAKMHTYKDAIRHTEGAFTLFPGNTKSIYTEIGENIIPSVGSFPLRPGEQDDVDQLKDFIRQAVLKLFDYAL